MTDALSLKPKGLVRGRPFAKGASSRPPDSRAGSRNKKTLAAAILLEGEAEALTRRAVERALTGDPTAMRLCIERILPPCRERAVRFALPPIESAPTGQVRGLKAHVTAPAMKAVTSALAAAVITPGEAGTIVAVVDTFVRAIETSDFDGRLKIMETNLPDRAKEVPEMFDVWNAGNSTYWEDLALDPR